MFSCVFLPWKKLNLLNYSTPQINFKRAFTGQTLKKRRCGYSFSGNILVRRKTPATVYLNSQFESTRFYSKFPSLVESQRLLNFKNALYVWSGAFTASGGLTPARNFNDLFAISFSDTRFLLGSKNVKLRPNILLYYKPGDWIRSIRDVFSPSSLLISSPGSKGVINYFDRMSGFLSIRLPSGYNKLFFFLSRCSFASIVTPLVAGKFGAHFKKIDLYNLYVDGKLKRQNLRFKAGLLGSYGFRPKVRGVAQNPVDHPHGGRTKSIRLPRTPWGLVTKKK